MRVTLVENVDGSECLFSLIDVAGCRIFLAAVSTGISWLVAILSSEC